MPTDVLIELKLIDDDPTNPRGDLGDVSALMQSIADRGQEDPIQLVKKANGRYLLHEGHRRRKALTLLGRTQAKAILRHFDSDLDRLLSQGAIHAHRKNFNPMAWARYCYRLCWTYKLNRYDIARQIGVSPGWVRDHLAFNQLTPAEQSALEAGDLTRKRALHILDQRRAAQTGRPTPPAKAKAKTGAARPTERHLTTRHRLAEQVAARCAASADHTGSPKIGGVGCGECWEHTIRVDAVSTARPALAAVAA